MSDSKVCLTPDCGKPATLQCPTCKKLGKNSPFCSQECFKTSWNIHKLAHIAAQPQPASSIPSRFGGFHFTGPLRPTHLTPKRQVPKEIPPPDYAQNGIPESERIAKSSTSIEIKTPEQIEGMRKVCKLAREVLDLAASHIKPGITTDELDEIVHKACIERNSYPSPLNYRGFPKSVCTSVNEVICHGIPDQRPLEEGDIVNIDVTLYHNGYHGDLNATYPVGKIDDKYKKLIKAAKDSLDEAVSICKPGVLYRDAGNVISKVVNKQNFSVVRSYCGHGIGELFHTTPNVPHYQKNKAVGVMKPGHTFTIEPMINEGTWKDVLWPDEWTSCTADGKRSAQFEHTLLITEDGVEVLTGPLQFYDMSDW